MNLATRRAYDPEDLGPTFFTVDQKYYCRRTDFEIQNRRFKSLQCSLFHHDIGEDDETRHPLIVFCHGNSGNRTYSYEIVSKMLSAQISVLTFDFAGCGLSDGKFVFQGLFEQYDIEDVIEYSLKRFHFIDPQRIGIWGRSMGAIAALLFAAHNHTAAFLIIDSPIKDFSDIINEYITRVKIIPNMIGQYILKQLRKRILQLASFDIEELKPIEMISTCTTPALFHHTNKDQVVPPQHSRDLYKAYPAEKEYLETEGGHNSPRVDQYYEIVQKFINKIFSRRRCVPEMGILCASTLQPHKNLGEDDFSSGMNDSERTIDNAQLKNVLEGSITQPENAHFDDSIDETIDDEIIDEKLLEKILENVSNDDEDFYRDRYDEPDEVIGDTEDVIEEPREQDDENQNQNINNDDDDNDEIADLEKYTINEEKPESKGFLIMNEKDDLFSAANRSPERVKINFNKEMSPEFSQIMSEPNLALGTIKPWKMLRVKSAQTSFFQEL